jgi:2-succinyl-6-hydroxy-2,4-cyclohexadiene-1-carboxylate synthase
LLLQEPAKKHATFEQFVRLVRIKERKMKIKAGNARTNHELHGEGECLVLIHGFTDNLKMWYNQVPKLSEKFKVLVYDVRGHGQTESDDNRFSIDLFADDLCELTKALKIEKMHVLGYSMGGRIGLSFALKYPEKVKCVILANSGIPGPSLQLSEQQLKEMAEKKELLRSLLETGDIEAISEIMAVYSFSPGLKDRMPEVFHKYKALKMDNDPRHYVAIMQAVVDNMDHPPDLTQLKCPLLIIAGEQDAFMSLDVAESMKIAMPHAEIEYLPTGHAAALEMPDQFNRAVIGFLKKLSA